MARPKNDGKGRLGGRAKGTPNKTTAEVKTWLSKLLHGYRKTIEEDFYSLTPQERLRFVASVLPYLVPKLQAVEAKVEETTPGDDHRPVIIFSTPKVDEDEQ